MKTTIKKIAAAAMAFTLLGTGTAVTKTFFPKSDNSLVASAERLCDNVKGKKYKVVAQNGVNIRKDASINSKKIGSLAKGSTFTVLSETDEYTSHPSIHGVTRVYTWGKVKVKGGYGWICLNYYDIWCVGR